MNQNVTDPSEQDLDRLARQIGFVYQTAIHSYGPAAAMSGSESDLSWLQRLIDARIFAPNQTWELQSLGLAFGSVLSTATGVDWVTVHDEHGSDPALQYPGTTVILYPLTMLSKRVEAGEVVDVQRLFTHLAEQIATLKETALPPDSPTAKRPWWRFWS